MKRTIFILVIIGLFIVSCASTQKVSTSDQAMITDLSYVTNTIAGVNDREIEIAFSMAGFNINNLNRNRNFNDLDRNPNKITVEFYSNYLLLTLSISGDTIYVVEEPKRKGDNYFAWARRGAEKLYFKAKQIPYRK